MSNPNKIISSLYFQYTDVLDKLDGNDFSALETFYNDNRLLFQLITGIHDNVGNVTFERSNDNPKAKKVNNKAAFLRIVSEMHLFFLKASSITNKEYTIDKDIINNICNIMFTD